ncbi:hypothetical protein HN832_02245 [archaeon]|jgi:hypothetical protein|nr:hypothetical protein [archaeon]MBT4373175.1 hypothetical protein [archaeon]MBT4531520.1 hypothetical protein [archaeon]MBT7001302.1 hypothetical protein [archaeon]MBT7282212.1 hypothetical protein [archaeon]
MKIAGILCSCAKTCPAYKTEIDINGDMKKCMGVISQLEGERSAYLGVASDGKGIACSEGVHVTRDILYLEQEDFKRK